MNQRLALTSLLMLTLTGASLTAAAQEYLVVGAGAPRANRHSCIDDVPALEASLKAKGLVAVEKILCVQLADSTDQFEPRFKAKSDQTIAVEEVLGARFASQMYCEVERDRMIGNTPKDTPVVDSACREVSAPNFRNSNDTIYQPVLVILKPTKTLDEATPYSAVALLVKATDDARVKALFPHENN